MRVYKREIKADQIGNTNKYRALGALVRLLNESIKEGNRGSLRAVRLIHQFNQWMSYLEEGKIIADRGMYARELQWYLNRSRDCLGESLIRNYLKARSRNLSKSQLINLKSKIAYEKD